MIKCHMCGTQVSESKDICPYCGNSVATKIHCPKCDSFNVELRTKEKDGAFRAALLASIIGLLGMFFNAVGEKTVIKCVCKDCGKKFKLD